MTALGRRLSKSWGHPSPVVSAAVLFFLVLLVGAAVSFRWITTTTILRTATASRPHPNPLTAPSHDGSGSVTTKPAPPPIPFSCPAANQRPLGACPSAPLPPPADLPPPSGSCPDYFRWIHEDLRPWRATGITQEMVERAGTTANFRLVVLGGRAYVERYRRSFQTRDVFTLWGVLQLLRRYPGRVPDLDLMFDCVDWPVVHAHDYCGPNAAAPPPPPLFRYCGNESTLDIVFPDWSFWGWPEINIKPWEALQRELKEGNERVRWMDREPYAYWKGNPAVAVTRQQLLKCNVSDSHDWNARVYAQNWIKESQEGFKESDLANQCIHRYKIYIEGSAWSVSEKYILACDSMTLVVTPRYYDFYSRGLMPVKHYWPVRDDGLCSSIEFAVDWGNSQKQKAQAIGKEASNFIQEKLTMDYVYDYMLHLLTEYAKLLNYKPSRPPKSVELCAEFMACPAEGLKKKFFTDSMVTHPRGTGPCSLPPPFSPVELNVLQRRRDHSTQMVEHWEQGGGERQESML